MDDLFGTHRARMIDERVSFLEMFTPREYSDLLQRWDTKIRLSRRHELAWMVLTAQKRAKGTEVGTDDLLVVDQAADGSASGGAVMIW
jgi:hypothetical protein